LKFDSEKEGLETVLRPWQAELMRWIWRVGEVDNRMAHAHLQESETPTSRASSINFLNGMAEEGFLTYRDTTTKGGVKRLYAPSKIALDEEAFRKVLADRIFDNARKELMDEEER